MFAQFSTTSESDPEPGIKRTLQNIAIHTHINALLHSLTMAATWAYIFEGDGSVWRTGIVRCAWQWRWRLIANITSQVSHRLSRMWHLQSSESLQQCLTPINIDDNQMCHSWTNHTGIKWKVPRCITTIYLIVSTSLFRTVSARYAKHDEVTTPKSPLKPKMMCATKRTHINIWGNIPMNSYAMTIDRNPLAPMTMFHFLPTASPQAPVTNETISLS